VPVNNACPWLDSHGFNHNDQLSFTRISVLASGVMIIGTFSPKEPDMCTCIRNSANRRNLEMGEGMPRMILVREIIKFGTFSSKETDICARIHNSANGRKRRTTRISVLASRVTKIGILSSKAICVHAFTILPTEGTSKQVKGMPQRITSR
jgi:hypothetical protein